ncbi:hypothetical protein ACFL03_01240 [Thermodesulfobacteriota bacterium]
MKAFASENNYTVEGVVIKALDILLREQKIEDFLFMIRKKILLNEKENCQIAGFFNKRSKLEK